MDAAHPYDRERLAAGIASYGHLWDEWRQLKTGHPPCSTLYRDVGFGKKPEIGAAAERYGRVIKTAAAKG